MFDINEIRERAQKGKDAAAEAIHKTFEKSGEIVDKMKASDHEVPGHEKEGPMSSGEVEEQINASMQRQVEILGQIFGADGMAQMAVNEEMLQKMVEDKVSEVMASDVENMMGQLFGEDMGVLAAALETLEIEDGEDWDEEPSFGSEMEEELYSVLEETMSRMDSLPEPGTIPYQKDDVKWGQFGILLSGIVSTLNNHLLDGMDVEAHVPVMEQQVVSIVRRSWGIDGRGDLLGMIRYLAQEGYILRYRLYGEAASPEELVDESMDEEERESVRRAWKFVDRYKTQYAPGFLAGWDIGRAAMLTRWGSFLGWITESEATGILWDLSQKVVEELHSWREFAQSYLFGGLMWKLLCGDSSAASYLGYIADAATNLLVGDSGEGKGQWRDCPWPAQRKIGFT